MNEKQDKTEEKEIIFEEQPQETGPDGAEEQKGIKKPGKWRSRLLIGALLAAAALGGFAVGQRKSFSGGSKQLMQNLSWLELYVDEFFLGEADKEALESGACKGYIAGLEDPYAAYYTKEEYEQLLEEDSGEYIGIGVTVRKDMDTGYVTVEEVNKNGPAYRAGIKAGDKIIAVDGTDTTGLSLQETVSAIKKTSNPVLLKIFRGDKTMEITVDKTQIEVESVEWEMKEDGIGYISVSQFIDNTAEQFDTAVTELESQGMKGMIIDLRDNGGGLLTACLDMASRILPEGELIVYTEDKKGNRTEYKSDSAKTVEQPIAVLVNENSASASEILTGCLKDYGKAVVVGEKTYGKGVVQNIMPLMDGSAVKMTVSQYYTPKGGDIQGVGVEPDVTVKMSDKKWAAALEDERKDTQLHKACEVLKQ